MRVNIVSKNCVYYGQYISIEVRCKVAETD